MRPVGISGGYSPLHTFNMDPRYVAKSLEEFKVITNNPGPFRVHFSKDYLDWYWSAYQTKVKNSNKALLTKTNATQQHLYTMPRTSARRKALEETKALAQTTLDKCARRHALLDVWERCPQYPYIDLSLCSPYHIHEITRKFLDLSLSVPAFWLRVVFFASLIRFREETFTKRFPYLQTLLPKINFSKTAKPEAPDQILPSSRLNELCVSLCKRHRVVNALEAHVVLDCLEKGSMGSLAILDTQEQISLDEITFKNMSAHVPRSEEALFHPDNLDLLRTYLFAEMNSWVTTNPFRTHPEARDVVTLPSADPSKITAPTPQSFFFAASVPQIRRLEARLKEAQDVHRYMAKQDENTLRMTSYNPKTFRAEIRDEINVKMERALAAYEQADQALIPKTPMEHMAEMSKKQGENPSRPTPYFFTRKLKADPTVSLALALDTTGSVRRRIFDAGKEMYLERLHYQNDSLRYVQHQQAKVALALLDADIEKVLKKDAGLFATKLLQTAATAQTSVSHVPLAERELDEHGALTTLSRQNYARRFMKPENL